MAASDILSQMQGIMNTYKGMGPIDTNAVSRDLSAKVGNFAPEYAELEGMRQAGYSGVPKLMEQWQQRFPQQEAGVQGSRGPGAMTGLSSIMGELGRGLGRTNVFNNILQQKKAGLQDIVGNVTDMYGQQRQGVMDQYNMLTPLYQQAMAQEEAERQRVFQAQQAAAEQAARERMAAAERAYRKALAAASTPSFPVPTKGIGSLRGTLGAASGLAGRIASRLGRSMGR